MPGKGSVRGPIQAKRYQSAFEGMAFIVLSSACRHNLSSSIPSNDMHVTIRTFTILGNRSREPLHQAAVYATTEQDAAPLMRSDWSQQELEVFEAAQNWARRNSFIVLNPRSGSFYGIVAGR